MIGVGGGAGDANVVEDGVAATMEAAQQAGGGPLAAGAVAPCPGGLGDAEAQPPAGRRAGG